MFRSPLVRLVAALVVVSFFVLATTVAVNPYGVWPSLFGRDLFPKKTARVNSVRMVKAYDLFNRCPDHVITGMSTVVWGIDPADYPVVGKSFYNGGIVGSSMIGQYYYIMRYLAQCPKISRVYLDVKFQSFTVNRVEPSDMIMSRLQGSMIDPADMVVMSFTRSALTAVYDTVEQARSGIVDQMLYDRGDGFHKFPPASDDVYYGNFMMYLNLAYRLNVRLSQMQVSYFRELVTELKRRNIEVVVYFGAVHPFLEYSNRFDGAPGGHNSAEMNEELKREIAKITDFYDFSTYSSLVGEDIAHTKYFIDDIHYRPALGVLMLKALNEQRTADMAASFGEKVTAANVESFLDEQRRGIDQWALDYPQYSAQIREHYAKSPVTTDQSWEKLEW
jgi:hypothetical protein